MGHPTAERIARLIRAGYPIIAVQSHEESRVLGHIAQIAKSPDYPKSLYVWAISSGILQVSPQSPAKQDGAATADPVAALRYVLESDQKEPAIYLFKDLHPYLPDPARHTPGDSVVMRLLRDLASALLNRHQTLILLSPSFNVPPDAEKDITVVDFPLPTAQELGEQLEAFVSRLPSGIPCDLSGREQIVRAMQGLTAIEADACLAQAVISNRRLDVGAIQFILAEKAQIIRQSGALEYYPERSSYADIGGLDLLKAWCREAASAYSDAARDYGIEPPKGLLLVGVPGCGKSLTAKAVAGGTRPLLRLDVGSLFGSLVGQSEAQTRMALKVAEAIAPCVLWLDEIEKSLGGGSRELDGGTSQRVLGTILTWRQESTAPVFTVATANDVSSLRPELIRRFEEVFFVDLPHPAERREILAIHLAKRKRNPDDFDLDAVVKVTHDFTGDELERCVKGALRRAFFQQREITTDDLLAVAGEIVPLATTMAESIARMREWAKRARPASSWQARPAQSNAQANTRAIEM